jgi:molybdopterin-guanine dinucleotide biosynthesis protein A
VPLDLVQRLWPAPAVAVRDGRTHHAVGLWPLSCAASLEGYLLSGGNRSVVGFARTLAMRAVAFDTSPFDPFFNINTPEDLRLAQSGKAGP